LNNISFIPGSSITDEQIERMALVIHDLAKRGNFAAIGVSKTLMPVSSMHEKRRIIFGTYAHLFELLTCLNMSLSSTADVDEMKRKLEKLANDNRPSGS